MRSIVFKGSDDKVVLIINSCCKALTKSLTSFEGTDIFVSMDSPLYIIVWNLESNLTYTKQSQKPLKISYPLLELPSSSSDASRGSRNHAHNENNFSTLFHSISILPYTLVADLSHLFCSARRCTDSGSDCKGNQLFIRWSS